MGTITDGRSEKTETALLAVKCLYELQDIDILKSVSSKFLARGNGDLRLGYLHIAAFVSTALFTFLGNSKNLKRLDFLTCTIQDNCSNHFKLLLNTAGNTITSFTCFGGLADRDVEYLSEALKSENCKLAKLNLSVNKITDEGVEYLSEAPKSENCKLTKLNLGHSVITVEVVEYLSEALKSENCKLTKLNLGHSVITDEGVIYLICALESENCKLTKLNLGHSVITDEGVGYLSIIALASRNCKLTKLNIVHSVITDEGVEYLREAL